MTGGHARHTSAAEPYINRIMRGDCLDVMSEMPDGCIDLIATDPPYNTKLDVKAYGDDRPDYIPWLARRLLECSRVLKPAGSIYVMLDWREIHYAKVEMDKIFGRDNFQNEIIWCWALPAANARRFNRCHSTMLFYSNGGRHTFNPPRMPYAASSLERAKHRFKTGGRGIESFKSGKYKPNKLGQVMRDYWTDISVRPVPKSTYTTQKPRPLFDRVILASSNPGDVVLDPFCGSGTTCAAAAAAGRRYVGIDENAEAVDIARRRLGRVGGVQQPLQAGDA